MTTEQTKGTYVQHVTIEIEVAVVGDFDGMTREMLENQIEAYVSREIIGAPLNQSIVSVGRRALSSRFFREGADVESDSDLPIRVALKDLSE